MDYGAYVNSVDSKGEHSEHLIFSITKRIEFNNLMEMSVGRLCQRVTPYHLIEKVAGQKWVRQQLSCLFLCISLCAYAQAPDADLGSLRDNILITAASGPQIYLFKGGRKYYIESSRWITSNGYGGEVVHVLKANEL